MGKIIPDVIKHLLLKAKQMMTLKEIGSCVLPWSEDHNGYTYFFRSSDKQMGRVLWLTKLFKVIYSKSIPYLKAEQIFEMPLSGQILVPTSVLPSNNSL